MMKRLHEKRGVITAFLTSLIITISTRQYAQELVSFDILFPQNWYTKTMQSCMHVWSDLDLLIAQHREMPFENQLMMVDATIGKITFCTECLKKPSKQDANISQEDIGYLMRIVYSLDNKCEKLTGRKFDEKLSCLQIRIKKLRNQLHALFDADGSAFGAGEQ